MLTNLIASIIISVVTNTTEVLPKHVVPDPLPPGQETFAVYYCHMEDDKNPKEKWITTNIIEITTIQFVALGQHYEARSERSITNWTTHFTLAAPEPTKWNYDTNNAPIPFTWFGR